MTVNKDHQIILVMLLTVLNLINNNTLILLYCNISAIIKSMLIVYNYVHN